LALLSYITYKDKTYNAIGGVLVSGFGPDISFGIGEKRLFVQEVVLPSSILSSKKEFHKWETQNFEKEGSIENTYLQGNHKTSNKFFLPVSSYFLRVCINFI
jgi:hypothetical protein